MTSYRDQQAQQRVQQAELRAEALFVIPGLLCCPVCRTPIDVAITKNGVTTHQVCPAEVCGVVLRLPARVIKDAAEAACPEFAAAEKGRREQAQAMEEAMSAVHRAQTATVRDG